MYIVHKEIRCALHGKGLNDNVLKLKPLVQPYSANAHILISYLSCIISDVCMSLPFAAVLLIFYGWMTNIINMYSIR